MTEEKIFHLPVVAIRGLVVMPGSVFHFDISRSASIKAVETALETDQRIITVLQRELEEEHPDYDGLHHVGTLAVVKQIVKIPRDRYRVLVEGKERVNLLSLTDKTPFLKGEAVSLPFDETDPYTKDEKNAMLRTLKDLVTEYGVSSGRIAKESLAQLLDTQELAPMVDRACSSLSLYYEDQQTLLEANNLSERFETLALLISKEIRVQEIKDDLQKKVHAKLDKNQREYVLREEMRQIREELGEDTNQTDAERFREEIAKLNAPDKVKEKLKKELSRFQNGSNNTAELGVIRTYIETMLEVPWSQVSRDNKNLKRAFAILEEDHYGLSEVKERVLEFLAVRILTKKSASPILCLVGPPGTGKTSIAKSIARSLGREYVRISLGGVHDEAEIRGHRKTYVGAMPGRIVNALITAGKKNPLMLLDEIDKVSTTGSKGDTFSALLEVLDAEQNRTFRDHYLEVPVDLSEVLFVTTANTTETIPRPLLDRMEVISVNSYTENEKMHIAMEHLIPKQKKRHGLKEDQLVISRSALQHIIRTHTREAGVRQLEREIGAVCRKSARIILEEKKKKVSLTERNLYRFLGKDRYHYLKANETNEVGIVRGLAWTQVGGDTLQIEVNCMPGKGEIVLTGQLGDVMKESAKIGLTFIRSIAADYGIDPDFFAQNDIHIHIPAGAVPKDGPSAGITMATAILSAASGIPVRADVAMTGEITLRGRVLAIGGLKEKLLAAKNAGIRTVIVPSENRIDVEEISEEITGGLTISFVEQMKEVLEIALAKEV